MVNSNQVRKATLSNENFAAVNNYIGTLTQNRPLTVDKVLKDNRSLPRLEIVKYFQSLAAAGFGKVVIGRKGYQTRFEPAYTYRSIARAVASNGPVHIKGLEQSTSHRDLVATIDEMESTIKRLKAIIGEEDSTTIQ